MGKTINVHGFPQREPAEEVKRFLECYTGDGTVYAIEIWQCKKGRGGAKVQFTSDKDADHIMSLAKKRLRYGSSFLKAWDVKSDIIPRPRTYVNNMESVTLHFGCQVSRDKFSVLWKSANVSVKFGFGLRKMYFFISYRSVDYKLELSYENIWQIELHRPRGQPKFLLVQLLGAPRIYEKLEDSVFSYFKEIPDDQWFRATDFTPSCCIGQSSTFCLQFPYSFQLPDLSENFAYYKEYTNPFILESCFSFSRNLDLVPIIGPPQGLELPFKILFKVCSLVQHGCLPGPSVDIKFLRLVDPLRIYIECIEHALEKLYNLKECCYEPVRWLNEQYAKYLKSRQLPKPTAITLDAGLVYVRRVQITPCKVYFCGPEVNMSNRVLRNYSEDIDNFLRVSFIDEELEKMRSTDLSPRITLANGERRTAIYKRILSILRNGIIIGNKKFDFLAFSSSQLRENSLWMFASRPGLTAAKIRGWMGDFRRIRNKAKYSARLGQSFSASTETLTVGLHEIEIIPDVKLLRGRTRYVFSDGIGKVSSDFARRVAIKCGLKNTPSAFQIRYGGYKGVVAVDPTSSVKLSLRESMSKYDSDNIKLDVLAWSKYQPCFLNRQLITLLSTLGVSDHFFEKKQREAVDQLDTILTDPLKAQEALELMSPGENTNILKEMLICGYKPDSEPFLSMMLQVFRASKLLELRTKTRIFVPNGRSMMGCLDETRTLEYGQVFVQFSGSGRRQFYENSSRLFNGSDSDKCNYIVEGKVVVAKNPCLHPGDVRVLKAVNVRALNHMVDCIVFPQKGIRPHPNECSGSDLDGDIYFVCWDSDMIPPQQIEPMDYTPAPSIELDHDVTIEEVQEYFTDYIVNDSLGIIANAHTVFADRDPNKAMGKPCVELAKLFSIAVDFPKTGVPAEIPSHLRVKEYPDFMEKPDKTTYESQCVIGKLFREVKDIAPHKCSIKSFTREVARRSYDPDMEIDGFEDYLRDAFNYKSEYDYKLVNLMDYYGIKTEAEILSGSIMKMSKSFDKRKDAEAVGLAVRSLRKEARTWFNKKGRESDDDEYAKASAWYFVTYHHTYWGCYNEGMDRDHFLSFPWCVYDKLIRIKKDKSNGESALNMHSLGQRFSYGLNLG
ncbi:probable RNA-dependent RNA polymerase 1 [Cornus florida]|uniref:probable RNA-dependent RNA polymerase 1 n=1 Tax=Cornus florida TaxID=4283 RepID=UPI00289B8B7C|nr:probable RNA-dependent RNA polymerase 1 [Cornus florida]XP_059649728.1 probable RNA-dependent RNA polymerase 1 [Cornus florida]